ncbi:WFDC1 [Mytilus edulis]|uniref:WFDC1 n=1 Tax=Mytilus edulis TaxID=6550 RepID=A0A8S3TI19_MYTED|nr:WFDC1 [Mytilus edulis]
MWFSLIQTSTIRMDCLYWKNYETSKDYLGDSVAGLVLQDNEKCPPLPEVISSSACMATPCFHDKDCGTSEGRCCDNGCVFTCFSYPIGPTYIDWVREPRRQQVNGISWLMKGPNLAEELEPCSTTYHEDEDPLLCPTGYICHVERLGNSKKDVPNLGHCIPEKDVFPTVDPNPSRHLETDCYLEKYLMADGAKIKVRNRTWTIRDWNALPTNTVMAKSLESFYPRTIRDWNALPTNTVMAKSLESFYPRTIRDRNVPSTYTVMAKSLDSFYARTIRDWNALSMATKAVMAKSLESLYPRTFKRQECPIH